MGSAGIRIATAAVLFVMLAGTWVAYDPKGLRLWWRLGHDVSEMQHDNAVLSAQVDRLERRAAALREDPKALERSARENGYVRPNEILIELK